MSAQSPGAYGLSALVHGAAVGLVLFFSYAASGVVQDSPKILELVAGEGDNYAATAAPALGSPGGIKLRTPPVDRTPPAPPVPAAAREASPIQSAPPERVPAAPKAAKPVDLVAELKRVEARREKRLEAKYQKEKAAEEKRMTQEQFQKEQAAKGHVSHIDAEGIRNGVLGGSQENREGGAGGKALTREEMSELDAYFALLRARIKENHNPPEGVSDSLTAKLEFFVAADGSLSHIHVIRSSGNTEFDESVIEACEHTRSIGPRPDGRSETVEMTFKMREDESP